MLAELSYASLLIASAAIVGATIVYTKGRNASDDVDDAVRKGRKPKSAEELDTSRPDVGIAPPSQYPDSRKGGGKPVPS